MTVPARTSRGARTARWAQDAPIGLPDMARRARGKKYERCPIKRRYLQRFRVIRVVTRIHSESRGLGRPVRSPAASPRAGRRTMPGRLRHRDHDAVAARARNSHRCCPTLCDQNKVCARSAARRAGCWRMKPCQQQVASIRVVVLLRFLQPCHKGLGGITHCFAKLFLGPLVKPLDDHVLLK